MQVSFAEVKELGEMRDNIRRSVNALELCWRCQKVAECDQGFVDDGGPVWLCPGCFLELRTRQEHVPGGQVWPQV